MLSAALDIPADALPAHYYKRCQGYAASKPILWVSAHSCRPGARHDSRQWPVAYSSAGLHSSTQNTHCPYCSEPWPNLEEMPCDYTPSMPLHSKQLPSLNAPDSRPQPDYNRHYRDSVKLWPNLAETPDECRHARSLQTLQRPAANFLADRHWLDRDR